MIVFTHLQSVATINGEEREVCITISSRMPKGTSDTTHYVYLRDASSTAVSTFFNIWIFQNNFSKTELVYISLFVNLGS